MFERSYDLSRNDTFFLQCAQRLGADLDLYFFAIDLDGFILEVGLPDFLGVALTEADIAAILLALAGEFAFLHNNFS